MKPERLSRKVVYESPWVNLYLDKVRFPSGHTIDEFHLLDFPHAAVTAVVEDDAGNIIFVRVPRYTTGSTEWELPAGSVDEGESVIEAARREVLEETGYATEGHRVIYSYYPMSGSGNRLFHVAHCNALERVQDFDLNEVSEIRWFTRDEVRQMIADRSMMDGFSLTAVLLWLRD